MKKKVNISFLSFLFLIGIISISCVKGDDFDIPEINFEEPNVTVNSSIASVKKMYGQYDEVPILIEGDSLLLEGYVISSDKNGNFHKELIIQDTPKNPQMGISISTDASDLYTFFEPGRKIYVLLDGLYIGENLGGVISIGSLYQGHVGRMSKEVFETHILRSGEVTEIIPTTITLNEVTDAQINTLIKFENMQFSTKSMGKSYGNMDNTYNVSRPLINCSTGDTITLRTSGYADFKNQLLPEKSGEIVAVLGKFNAEYQISIRGVEDVDFGNPRCGGTQETDSTETEEPFFVEDFEESVSGENITLEGWTNVNLNDGNKKYQAGISNTNQFAQVSARNSGENPLEAWLVTPKIDLTQVSDTIYLSFDTKDGFYNGEGLTVYISTDFSGNVKTASWTELSANISTGSTDSFADKFTPSGNIDISSYAGKTISIGFQYMGADKGIGIGITTSYQIDNIKVLGY